VCSAAESFDKNEKPAGWAGPEQPEAAPAIGYALQNASQILTNAEHRIIGHSAFYVFLPEADCLSTAILAGIHR